MEIRPSADLRNRYSEISQFCKTSGAPVFLTVNGKGDTVVMSIFEYKRQQAALNLLEKLNAAKDDIINGRVHSHDEVFGEVDALIAKRKGNNSDV